MQLDPLAFSIIATLAGLLTAGIIWFLVMIHNDVRALRESLSELLQKLPLDYLRKADYLDDERAYNETVRHIHRRIDAVKDGGKEPRET